MGSNPTPSARNTFYRQAWVPDICRRVRKTPESNPVFFYFTDWVIAPVSTLPAGGREATDPDQHLHEQGQLVCYVGTRVLLQTKITDNQETSAGRHSQSPHRTSGEWESLLLCLPRQGQPRRSPAETEAEDCSGRRANHHRRVSGVNAGGASTRIHPYFEQGYEGSRKPRSMRCPSALQS